METEFKVGDRVRVKYFGSGPEVVNEYTGLEGTVAAAPTDGGYIHVRLDKDPFGPKYTGTFLADVEELEHIIEAKEEATN